MSLSDKVCICCAVRVTRIAGFFFWGGGAQFTRFDAILLAPLLLQEKVFLFSVRQCNKLHVSWCMRSSEKVLGGRKTEGFVGSSFSGLKPYDRVLLADVETI